MSFYFESEILNRLTAEGHRAGVEVRREDLPMVHSQRLSAKLCVTLRLNKILAL